MGPRAPKWTLCSSAKNKGVGDPQLPRKRSVPNRFKTGAAEPEFHQTVKEYYRQIYYEAFDSIVNLIKDRFDQKDYVIYSKLQNLLLKCAGWRGLHIKERITMRNWLVSLLIMEMI